MSTVGINVSKWLTVLLFVGFFFAAAATLDAATYYLDAAHGNDSNPGTSDQPWRTLSRAYPGVGSPAVTDGDTVILYDGFYGSFSRTGANVFPLTDWITYKAADGHTPILNNIILDVQSGQTYHLKGYLRFEGITIRLDTNSDKRFAVWCRANTNMQFIDCVLIGWGYGVVEATSTTNTGFTLSGSGYLVDGCLLRGLPYGDELAAMADNIVAGDIPCIKTMYQNRLAQLPSVDINPVASVLYGFGNAVSPPAGSLTVQNTEIRDSFYGILGGSDGLTIRNCNIYNIGNDNLHLGGQNLLIEDNEVYDNLIYKVSYPDGYDPEDTVFVAFPELDGAGNITAWRTKMTNPNGQWNTLGNYQVGPAFNPWVTSGSNVIQGETHQGAYAPDHATYPMTDTKLYLWGDVRSTAFRNAGSGTLGWDPDHPTHPDDPDNPQIDPRGERTITGINYFFRSRAHPDLLQFSHSVSAQTNNVTIRGNKFHRAEGQIVWGNPGGVNYNWLVENNLFSGTSPAGGTVNFSGVTGLVMRNNTIIGNLTTGGEQAEIYNNIIARFSGLETVQGTAHQDWSLEISGGRLLATILCKNTGRLASGSTVYPYLDITGTNGAAVKEKFWDVTSVVTNTSFTIDITESGLNDTASIRSWWNAMFAHVGENARITRMEYNIINYMMGAPVALLSESNVYLSGTAACDGVAFYNLFTGDVSAWETADDDSFALANGSAAIGYSHPTDFPETDILGISRIGSPDCGAYQFGSGDRQEETAMLLIYSLGADGVTIANDAGLDIVTNSAHSIEKGMVITLTAPERAQGAKFGRWTGAIESSNRPISLLMDSDKSVTAVFELIDYTVNVMATDGGTVQWSPQETYRYDEVVVLEAKSASGYKLARWEDGAIETIRQVLGPKKKFQLGTGQTTELFRAYNTDGWDLAGMTIALWAKPESVAGSHYLIGHTTGQTANSWSDRIQLYIRDGQLGLGLGDTHSLKPTIASIEAGQWYHIALRFGNGTYTVYIGGHEVASGSYAGLTGFHGFFDVGNTGNAAKRDETFVGEIDELRVFADIVEPEQIQRLAEGNYRDFENGTILEITVTEDLSIRAVFTDNPYALTTSAVNGTVSRSPDRADYTTGEVVTLTAQADAGYAFVGWSGDAEGTATPLLLTMTGDTAVTAVFEATAVSTYTVTFNLDGKGTRTGGGALIQTIPYGSAATAPTVTANTGWVFTAWDKTFSNITSNLTVNAQYTAQTYTLGVTAANGTVSKRVNGVVTTATSFAHGTVVSLTATATTGYTFANWSGSATGTANPVSVTMNGNKTVTANFTQNTYTLGITANDGSVTKRVNGVITTATSFAHGTVVSLTAAANIGYTFANWSGSATGTANSVSITMDGNKAVTANFTQIPLVLDPVAQWLFNYPHQTTALDLISGQAAGLINDPEWGEGWAQEYFVRLGSAQQAVQVPMNACSAEAGTVALWVTPQVSNDTQYLFGHTFNSGNRIALYTVYTANGNALTLGMGNAIALSQNIAILSPDVLYHIVLTWNNGSYAVYVNGIEAASGSYTGLNALNSYADVGNYGNADARTLGFRGLVEEVQLHSRALNPSEVQALFLTHNVKENRPIEFVVNGTDSMGNPISYTASELPEGASFNVATQTFSWRPALYNTAGRYEIFLSAPGQPTQTITVAVQDVQLAGWYEAFLAQCGLD